jgi:NhaA family Na+:H+ antiporter
LANAGVRLSDDLASSLLDPIALGYRSRLSIGKQLGLYGVSLLCGIGFTMSLFIATRAFDTGVLEGSIVSAIVGDVVLAGAAGSRGKRRDRES